MLWDVDISENIVVSAPYGGAIAVTRDPGKLVAYRGPESRQSKVTIYSGCGNHIHTIPWDNGSIKGIGWSRFEQLLIVSSRGNVRVYYDFDGNFVQFSLGKIAEINGVHSTQFSPNSGLVARLNNGRFVSVSRFDDPNPHLLAELPSGEETRTIRSWAIVPTQDYSLGQHSDILVATDSALFDVTTTSAKERRIEGVKPGPLSLVASPFQDDLFGAFYEDGSVTIFRTSGYNDLIVEFDSGMKERPSQMVWCGKGVLALIWGSEALLIDSDGSSLPLVFDDPIVVFPETSGMRLLSNQKHDFFTIVPPKVVRIFRLGSTAPSAILRDCVDHLDRGSAKADENLLIIGDRLPSAVDDCTEAAAYEFESSWQKKLLRAASFGKAALEAYDSDNFVRTCEYIRVLNTVRNINVGILMDYQQLLELTPRALIDRLLMRKLHHLAFRCAEYLRLPTEDIYVHWACSKIRASPQDDETLFQQLIPRLTAKSGIMYDQIAATAFEEGRTKLAIAMLEYESRPDKQVPQLLKIEEHELALLAAVNSYNWGLIFYVLSYLHKHMSIAAFFKLIDDKPLAAKCFEMMSSDDALLENFYYQGDKREDNAMLKYRQALGIPYDGHLLDKTETLELARLKYSDIPTRNFETKAIESQIDLVKIQQQLTDDYEKDFRGLSVSDTIYELLMMAQNPRAQKLKDTFKVPDRRFWWLKLRALVARRDWDNLHKFATGKKSPIGYGPFFEETFKAGNRTLAAQFVPMSTELTPSDRISMYIKVNELQSATQEAIKAKDVEALENLEPMVGSGLQSDIQAALRHLKK